MRRRNPRRRKEKFRERARLWGGFLLALLLVFAATSWWSSLPAPREPEEITCPDIEDVIGDPTWDEYKNCKTRYYTQLICTDLEKTLYRLQDIKESIF